MGDEIAEGIFVEGDEFFEEPLAFAKSYAWVMSRMRMRRSTPDTRWDDDDFYHENAGHPEIDAWRARLRGRHYTRLEAECDPPWCTVIANVLWHAGRLACWHRHEEISVEERTVTIEATLVRLTETVAAWPDAWEHRHHYITTHFDDHRYPPELGIPGGSDVHGSCSCGLCRHGTRWIGCIECCGCVDTAISAEDFAVSDVAGAPLDELDEYQDTFSALADLYSD